MTKKHFIELANMLASHAGADSGESEDFSRGYETARQDIGGSLAAICRLHNENFDASRFYDAAGLS